MNKKTLSIIITLFVLVISFPVFAQSTEDSNSIILEEIQEFQTSGGFCGADPRPTIFFLFRLFYLSLLFFGILPFLLDKFFKKSKKPIHIKRWLRILSLSLIFLSSALAISGEILIRLMIRATT